MSTLITASALELQPCTGSADINLTCMMCGKDGRLGETEPDTYREYGSNPEDHCIWWIYCKPCDCWTQHGICNHASNLQR